MTSASEHSQKMPRFLKTLLWVALCLYTDILINHIQCKQKVHKLLQSQTLPWTPDSCVKLRSVSPTWRHCYSCSSPSQTATPRPGPAGLSTQQPPCLAKVLWWLPTAFRNPLHALPSTTVNKFSDEQLTFPTSHMDSSFCLRNSSSFPHAWLTCLSPMKS